MTTALATQVPDALQAALVESHRRIAAAEAEGRTFSTEEPSIIVINDAPNGLKGPTVRKAVEELARDSVRSNMSVELRGHIVPNSSKERTAAGGLTPEDLGGSRELCTYALGPAAAVYYRCLRPAVGVPSSMLVPGTTRVVHNDPSLLATGRTDTGTFVGFHTDRSWASVRFDGNDWPDVLLVSDLLVEIAPE